MSILVLQSSWWERESWLLCLICPPGVSWWLCGSSSRCRGVVCGLWLLYFLIILTYYFYGIITEPVFTDDKVYNVGSLLFQIAKRYERVAYNMDIMKQYAYLVMNPITLYFVVRYFMSILVLQSSWWGRESWLFCLICPPGVSWWLCGSSSRCRGVVCGLWLWYFLIILTYYFLWYYNRTSIHWW